MILPIKILAAAMNLSKSALMTWLGHYTLSKFVVQDMEPDSYKNKRAINYNKAFIKAFSAYCEKKFPQRSATLKPRDYYKKKFEKFVEYFEDEKNADQR